MAVTTVSRVYGIWTPRAVFVSELCDVFQVPELRLLFPNGSLVFPAFSNDRYRHDVHAALYRCKLKSALGTVVSREVHIKASEL